MKIKAYTIIEMLVVMLISSVSIGITYTCYTIFSNHYRSYKKRSDELAKYIVLDKLLTTDISACKEVHKSLSGVDCVYLEKIIRYEFHDAYILRKSMIIDTFFIKSSSVPSFTFMGKQENIPGGFVDKLTFETIHHDESLTFRYQKKYGVDVLINKVEVSNQY